MNIKLGISVLGRGGSSNWTPPSDNAIITEDSLEFITEDNDNIIQE